MAVFSAVTPGTKFLNSFAGTVLPGIAMMASSGIDSDGDGMSDIVERVVGTQSGSADSDGDGIRDLAELLAGTDPLGGRATATGTLANLSLRGEAKAVGADQAIDTGIPVVAVATGSYGLAFVDVSQPARPTLLREIDLAGDSTDVAFDGALGVAAVASNVGGLNLVTLGGTVLNIAINAAVVEIADGIVYASNGSELRSYDALTGERLQTLSLGNSPIVAMAREGQMLYTVDGARRLRAIDLSSGVMLARGSLVLPAAAARLFVGGGLAYIGAGNGGTGGFMSASVANPDALILLSGVDSNSIAGTAIAATGSGIGVAVGSSSFVVGGFRSLDVVDLSSPTNTAGLLTRFNLPQVPFDVSVAGGLAFVADGAGGLQVLNFRPADTFGKAPVLGMVTGVSDLDPAAAGTQVAEGSTIQLAVTVSDDVQVRDLAVLMNGKVVRDDLSFPFTLSANLPTLAANGEDTVTLQVRATDTGGNVSLSAPLVLQLVPDTLPPSLVTSNITDGTSKGRSFRAITLSFSEALDPATVSADSIVLIGPDGAVVTPVNIQFRLQGREVQLTYASLAVGAHQLDLAGSSLSDRAGNMLAADQHINFSIETYSAEWVGAPGGYWDVASNWSTGVVPTAADDVYIGPDAGSVTVRGGTVTVGSLVSDAQLKMASGSLSVSGDASLRGGVQVQGGTLTLNGDSIVGGTLALNGGTLVADGSLDVAKLLMSAGTLSGGGSVSVIDSSVWSGGTLRGTGTLNFNGDLAISGDAYKYIFDGRVINLGGTTTWSGNTVAGSNRLRFGAGTINNAGTFIDANAFNSFMENYYSGTLVFNNAGTFRKDRDTVTSLDVVFNNQGVLDVQLGTTSLFNGGTSDGSFKVAAGATLRLGRGVHVWQAEGKIPVWRWKL